jgi:hypothetical protein
MAVKSALLCSTVVYEAPTEASGASATKEEATPRSPLPSPPPDPGPLPPLKKYRAQQPRGPPSDLDAYSIREFCRRHSLTPYLFYKLQRDGQAPKVMIVGGRKFISAEAAAKWRKARERTATPRPERGERRKKTQRPTLP